MRISVIPDDAGYKNLDRSKTYTVTVDGIPVDYCYTADEEEGLAICWDRTHTDDSFATVEMRGVVVITEDAE